MDTDNPIILCILLVVILCTVVVAGKCYEYEQWSDFAKEHHCKLTQVDNGEVNTGFGITANGNLATVVTTSPRKKAYLCDDGITYWREE